MNLSTVRKIERPRYRLAVIRAPPSSLLGRIRRDVDVSFSGELVDIRTNWSEERSSRFSELIYVLNDDLELPSRKLNEEEVRQLRQNGAIDTYNLIMERSERDKKKGLFGGVSIYSMLSGVGTGASMSTGDAPYVILGAIAGGVFGGILGNAYLDRSGELMDTDLVRAFRRLEARAKEGDDYISAYFRIRSNGRN